MDALYLPSMKTEAMLRQKDRAYVMLQSLTPNSGEVAAPSTSQPLTPHEIGAFVGTHEFGPEQLKWFRFGEAAHGIKGGE
jgi:hypothetical protein